MVEAARPLATTTTMAGLLGAFAYANDMAFGLELDDSARSAHIANRIAEEMALSAPDRLVVYYTALLKDTGCTSWTSTLARYWETDEIVARRELVLFGGLEGIPSFLWWLVRHVGHDRPPAARARAMLRVLREQPWLVYEGFATARDVAIRISTRLGMPQTVVDAVCSLFERWDGKGMPEGAAGSAIPIASRIVHPTFVLSPVFRRHGRQATTEVVRRQRGVAFDPGVSDAFLSLARRESFWEELERPDIWDSVLAEEPAAAVSHVSEAHLDDVALAFADFADLKSPYVHAHSRRTAKLGEALARQLGCSDETATLVRRAGLVHDLGLVALPSVILDKPPPRLTSDERERVRLHPYHTERLLARVPAFSAIAAVAGLHHERMDGHGYFRGLSGPHIPLAARILAVASRFDELTHDAPGRDPLTIEQALQELTADAGAGFAADVVGALPGALGLRAASATRHKEWPAGLSSREVEVLRLAGRGLTRRDIAQELRLSENTVRHHLEHIYNKTGASTRIGAVLFGMEHGLFE